jgi:hypothetical protein
LAPEVSASGISSSNEKICSRISAFYNFAAVCCKIFYKEGLSKMRTIPVEVELINKGFLIR